ncbi:MAG: T9SS type A sorting domain-containing protein [candidate division Zixibacteria bacterium]|nr:T9SS type A sorting domain-containing protein [candidate division Zixibacteria bacterium]
MPRVIIILLLMAILIVPVSAQDPGLPDSLIIDMVAAEMGAPSIMLPVYVVTDDPVAEIILPLQWESFDNQINLAGAYYFNTLLEWDETSDTVNLAFSQMLVRGINDTGGDPNPVLDTDYQRELAMFIRIVIHDEAGEQFVPIYNYIDETWGHVQFVLDNGETSFDPIVVAGGVLYQAVGIDEYDNLPAEISLNQNYPNPFNPDTEISFAIPKSGQVSLEIYDILGRRITTLLSDNLEAGYYSARWNGTDESGNTVSTGMYFYTLNTGDTRISKKMLLLK